MTQVMEGWEPVSTFEEAKIGATWEEVLAWLEDGMPVTFLGFKCFFIRDDATKAIVSHTETGQIVDAEWDTFERTMRNAGDWILLN